MKSKPYQWAAAGDVNAFFGLMLDNIAGLILTVSLLAFNFGFPVDFALRYMIPGTALGVLVGDLLYFYLAFRLAHREQTSQVTAMPLGLDTPSTIGMVLFVLGPAYKAALENGLSEFDAAMQTWHIGICAIVITGLIKALLAVGSNWLRRVFPRAGLLGSLAAIALVIIAFTQMTELAANPVIGFSSLAIVFVTLIARGNLPFKIPGAFGAVLLGSVIWYLLLGSDSLLGTQLASVETPIQIAWFPLEWLSVLKLEWLSAFGDALAYTPYILPFAIATVIGGIDCTESAASAGDKYETASIIGIEAFATLVAGLFGGVIQTTPYIGHPAYKAMGGRSAYALATALFIGGAGLIGYFGLLFMIIPKAAILPILIFIGIEITAQSFHATPRRHYAALAIACIPAIAKLVMIYLNQFSDAIDYSQVSVPDASRLNELWMHLQVLAGGFIITSLIWASAMAMIIDRRFFQASLYFGIAGILTLFGIMHSPIPGDKMFLPWAIDQKFKPIVLEFAAAYLVMSSLMFTIGLMFVRGLLTDHPPRTIDSDRDYEEFAG